jgi:aldose sugar dehydrogenase
VTGPGARRVERAGANRHARRVRRRHGGGSRIAFGGDGMLYMSAGGSGDAPQDPSSLGGKVLRLTDDGKVPADNPFVGMEGYRPEIFTLGHRNTLGLAPTSRHRRDLAGRDGPQRG